MNAVIPASPKPQDDSSSPSRGVSGYPPALSGRYLRASPCSAPLPGASEHQRRAGLSSFQRLLKLYARDRLGSAFRVSKPPPPRGSRRVVSCWQGTDTYTKVRGSELSSLPPPNTLNTTVLPASLTRASHVREHEAAVALRSGRGSRPTHTAVNHSPPNPHRLASQPARMLRAATKRGEDDTEREPGRQLAGGSDLGRVGMAPCACSLGWMRSRGCRLDVRTRREKRMGGSATQHTLYCGYAGRRPPGTARRRWGMLSRPIGANRDTAVYRACVRCGLARRVRHSCHHFLEERPSGGWLRLLKKGAALVPPRPVRMGST